MIPLQQSFNFCHNITLLRRSLLLVAMLLCYPVHERVGIDAHSDEYLFGSQDKQDEDDKQEEKKKTK